MKTRLQSVFNIRDYKATGRGTVNDGPAVQQAIDDCHAAGGGMVYCPPGLYRIGTLYLRGKVNLHVERGAVLLGSPLRADYTAKYNPAYDQGGLVEKAWPEHLICAYREHNIAITGAGIIDGNSDALLGKETGKDGWYNRRKILDWRPSQMIAFWECEDVTLEGIHLLNAPYWTVWPYGCRRVRVGGVTIRNPPWSPNGDGIDPDCCADVIIHDCIFETGDDCIAIRSANGLNVIPHGSENITITNSVLRSRTLGIRIGFCGDSPIRNVTISNLIIEGSTGIGFQVAKYSAPGHIFNIVSGAAIEDVVMSNCILRSLRNFPVQMFINGDVQPPAGIRRITLKGLRLEGCRGVVITGHERNPIRDIRISDVDLRMTGEWKESAKKSGYYDGEDYFPDAICCRHVDGLSLHDVSVKWDGAIGPWKKGLALDAVTDADVRGVQAEPYNPGKIRDK